MTASPFFGPMSSQSKKSFSPSKDTSFTLMEYPPVFCFPYPFAIYVKPCEVKQSLNSSSLCFSISLRNSFGMSEKLITVYSMGSVFFSSFFFTEHPLKWIKIISNRKKNKTLSSFIRFMRCDICLIAFTIILFLTIYAHLEFCMFMFYLFEKSYLTSSGPSARVTAYCFALVPSTIRIVWFPVTSAKLRGAVPR